MFIRMKGKYYNGFSKCARTPLKEDPVPPGCLFREERLRLRNQLQGGQITPRQYVLERQTLFADAPFREPRDSLVMRLDHGDMVIMNGERLQKLYEHSVRPYPGHGVRFAATARFINQ